MFVVSPRLGVVSPSVISVVAPPGPVGSSSLGQDGAQDEALTHCYSSQGNTHSYRAQEDGLGQGLEDSQDDDGEEGDVLHCCSLCVLQTRSALSHFIARAGPALVVGRSRACCYQVPPSTNCAMKAISQRWFFLFRMISVFWFKSDQIFLFTSQYKTIYIYIIFERFFLLDTFIYKILTLDSKSLSNTEYKNRLLL